MSTYSDAGDQGSYSSIEYLPITTCKNQELGFDSGSRFLKNSCSGCDQYLTLNLNTGFRLWLS